MVSIKYGDKTYSIKNDVNELTIGEYEKINYFLNGDSDFFDKWFSILDFLGLPKSVIDDLDANEMISIIKSINLSEIDSVYVPEIEIGGYLYKCEMKDDVPRITGKTFKFIEKVCKKDYYIADIMAILFKRVDLSDVEHYDMNHIDYKASLFRKEKAAICIPYILLIADRYVKNIKSLK